MLTELDIVLVSSITGKPLAKPYATFLTDAYSCRLLAAHVSYEPPSYRSVMMAFRLCVKRYGRLPQEIVVDHGPEFGSVYFEALLSQCFVTKINRPPRMEHWLHWHSQRLGGGNGCHALPCWRDLTHP